jgi:hypothetical protein
MESTSSTIRFESKIGPSFLRVHISDRFGMKSTQTITIYTNFQELNSFQQPFQYLIARLNSVTDNVDYHDGVILIDAFSSFTSTVIDQRSVNKLFFFPPFDEISFFTISRASLKKNQNGIKHSMKCFCLLSILSKKIDIFYQKQKVF